MIYLLILLLLPVVAVAETCPGRAMCSYDKHGDVIVTYQEVVPTGLSIPMSEGEPVASCDLDYTNCIVLKPDAFPCYAKMREAMRNMRIVVDLAALDKRVVPNKFAVEQWNATYKECVQP
ncbi:MAG: hypothetical protein OEY86_07600 [Nitrospira sp.]|nr:hypothetical protein [Nitrospira sp.]